jgi:hypothetical protein
MMNEKVKKSYNVIVQYVIENSILKKPVYDFNSLNERQKKWLKLAPEIYVIGPKHQMEFFEREADNQGFLPLVNFLYPKMINELLISHKEDCEIIIDWIIEEYGGRPFESEMYEFYVFGCHISHVIVSIDMMKNKTKRALIFENDAKFYNYVEDKTLDMIIDLYENDLDNEIGFLNLGFYLKENDSKEFKLFRGQTATAHTYIINQETSKLLVDGINLNNVVPKGKNKTNDEKELSYRCGADGFFGGFVDNFFLNLPLTYQQFIGTNREQSYL